MLIWLLLLLVSLITAQTSLRSVESAKIEVKQGNNAPLTKKRECRELRKQYHVNPGISWGTLTSEQQDHWMELECDQFFCEPNKLAGKGVYKCVPLKKEGLLKADKRQ